MCREPKTNFNIHTHGFIHYCRYIADLDSETVYAYENKRSNQKRTNCWKSQVAGNDKPLLIKFFLSDTNFITFYVCCFGWHLVPKSVVYYLIGVE